MNKVIKIVLTLGMLCSVVLVKGLTVSAEDEVEELSIQQETEEETEEKSLDLMDTEDSDSEEAPLEEGSIEKIQETEVLSVRSTQDSVVVTTEAELLAELMDINTISGTVKTIDITSDIVLTQQINVDMNQGKDVEIISTTGAQLTSSVGKKHFNVLTGPNALTLRGLKLIGNIESTYIDGETLVGSVDQAAQGGGVTGALTGMFTVDNVVFKFIKEKALDVDAAGGALIKNSSFIANSSPVEGIAIRVLGQDATYTIENSTFKNNRGHHGAWKNYANPVIYLGNARDGRQSTTTLVVKNNVFLDNYTLVAGTNSSATGGGAIGLKQANGNVLIEDNYFEGNEVAASIGAGIGNGTTADGGAFYAFWSPGKIEVIGNTFYKNAANDEGGAISIVASTHQENIISNNTFVENVAKGLQVSSSWGFGNDGNDGGGAIEINGDSSTFGNATIINNTFYNNTAELGYTWDSNNGGAVSFKYATGTLSNNVMVGNTATQESTNNLFIDTTSASTVTVAENIVDESVESVFYTTAPTLAEYNNQVMAGNPNDGSQQIISVLHPIAPNNGSSALGLADGVAVDAVVDDQRNYTRTSLPDMGSLEIVYVEFNSNGGLWIKGADETFYDGSLFYAAESNGALTEQLLVTYPSGTVNSVSDAPQHALGLQFVGWNTDPNATEALSDAEIDAILSNVTENRVLYAIWVLVEDTTYTVNFYDCEKEIVGQDWVNEGGNATPPSGYTYAYNEYTNVNTNRDVFALNCSGGFLIPNTATK